MTLKELLRTLQGIPQEDRNWAVQISIEQDGMEIEADIELVALAPDLKTVVIFVV